MKLQHNQFRVNEAWIACRLQTLDRVAGDPVDVYILLDAASGYVFGPLLVLDDLKGAWEKALTYAPHDEVTRRNLHEFIYDNDGLSDEIRKPSAFVARLFL